MEHSVMPVLVMGLHSHLPDVLLLFCTGSSASEAAHYTLSDIGFLLAHLWRPLTLWCLKWLQFLLWSFMDDGEVELHLAGQDVPFLQGSRQPPVQASDHDFPVLALLEKF